MQRSARKFSLPVAAMLIAALSGYLGLPQLELLCRVAPDAVVGARFAQPVLCSSFEQRRAHARSGSAEAQQLELEHQRGKRALDLIAGAPNFAGTTAPSFSQPTEDGFSTRPQPPALSADDLPVAAWVALVVTPVMDKPPPGDWPQPSAFPQYVNEVTLRSPRGPPATA